ncbi:MAG: hypothetical protein M3081_15680 [Gemmatimonadota bacterium]|nr:hypothetical protein [Gemmatimonadota bacterium]
MSTAQRAAPLEPEVSGLRALLMRGTFNMLGWGNQRQEGREHTIRLMIIGACLFPAIMITAQVVVLLVTRLPLGLMLTSEYLVWAVPVMIAFPPLIYFSARVSWDLSEERYRLERAKLGEPPTPANSQRVEQ